MIMSDAEKSDALSDAELNAEAGTALPDKEVVSILDLNADLDIALDVAAPVDLAVAANANVAAPIDAAVGANILSEGSTAQALSDQGVMIDQGITGDASADATQDSTIAPTADGGTTDAAATGDPSVTAGGYPDQTLPDGTVPTDGTADGTTVPTDGTTLPTDGTTLPTDGTTLPTDATTQVGDTLDGDLLNVDVNLAADAGLAAPIDGAVAANANVAAPIDAAVAANVGSVDSDAVAIAQQDAIINQNIEGDATANADQTSDISNP